MLLPKVRPVILQQHLIFGFALRVGSPFLLDLHSRLVVPLFRLGVASIFSSKLYLVSIFIIYKFPNFILYAIIKHFIYSFSLLYLLLSCSEFDHALVQAMLCFGLTIRSSGGSGRFVLLQGWQNFMHQQAFTFHHPQPPGSCSGSFI